MLKVLKIEWYKLRRTKLILTATFLPLLAVFQGRLFALSKEGTEPNLWGTMYIGTMSQYTWLLFPILITVVIAIMARMEHSNNNWKQLLSLPVKRESVYLSKLIICLIIIFYSIFVLIAGMVLAGISIRANGPVPIEMIVKRPLISAIASLPIISLQFYLSYRFSHFGIPLVAGIGMSLPSMLIANSEKYWIFYPWTYPIVSGLTEIFGTDGKGPIMYAVCFVSFFVLILFGFHQFRKKDIF
ncbi:ABC transporter permease [Bacillus methanolicus]|uniref:MrsE n=1 Tax=Bacillus methanolicus (strain MGA3 / ATCC 53907) TaxID=796606 RepID=I3E2Y2_BACMM|nr:ABC transporter permease [Bacillus methanolicus]AIE59052.1 hypothetical protein BMMGA3_02950 [Bacillus methanolicus MGA3]EIJ80853.1 hypothetical protein MGA3_11150 [Bacillus methanolicus MGA3]UQD51138.1 hypothetical protein C0971_03140 [Bacillus methanolicus]